MLCISLGKLPFLQPNTGSLPLSVSWIRARSLLSRRDRLQGRDVGTSVPCPNR
ncbi:hypothetical protein IE4872_CH01543 [Rhizobium gallicum]|uniref:Uncharacterized protein n=1 Tax=Rhizobium gallicum TaxID=56730 RepID=A0A1L5NH23_9HYPH|nr:hypothetical protein IE4872_CH01543 [Rhizobium gallicum]